MVEIYAPPARVMAGTLAHTENRYMDCNVNIGPVKGKARRKAEYGRSAESFETVRGYRASIIEVGTGKQIYRTSVCLTEAIAQRVADAWIRANVPVAVANAA